MTKVKINAFVKTATEGINKTETELVVEKVNEFLDEARTEITVQLAQANAEVIRSKAFLSKEKAHLVKAKKEFEVSRTTTPASGTLAEYISNRQAAEFNLNFRKAELSQAELNVKSNELVVIQYQDIEKDLA